MASTKVIIVGAGIAGPVLGMLLKMRGYKPIVYERLPAFSTAGLSLVYAFLSTFTAVTLLHRPTLPTCFFSYTSEHA